VYSSPEGYLGLDHVEEFRELYPEPVSVLEELVLVLCIKLIPVLSSLCVIRLNELLGNGVEVLARNLVSCVLFLLLAPCCVIPMRGLFQWSALVNNER
jgi:hypothetical protein